MILDRILAPFSKRGSIENPAIPLTGENIMTALSGGLASASGVTVNRQAMLGLPPALRAINLISDSVATLHCYVYRILGAGKGKDKDRAHPAYRLVRREVAENVKASDFRKTLQAQALLEGNAFAWIQRDANGDPVRLQVCDAERSTLVNVTDPQGRSWLMYRLQWTDAGYRRYEKLVLAENVLHIKGLSYDGLVGYRLIEFLKDPLGIPLAAQRYGGKFFASDCQPGVLIQSPLKFGSEEEVEQFRQRFADRHGGIAGSHRPAVLEPGWEVKPYPAGSSHKDSQFVELRQFSVREVANAFNIPPELLGDDAKTSYASLEQQYQSYLLFSIQPLLEQWEAEYWTKLLREREKEAESHTIKFERKGWSAANLAERTQFFQFAVTHKVMSPNEIREVEDMNPYPGGDEMLALPNESVESDDEEDQDQDDDQQDDSQQDDVQPEDDRIAKLRPMQQAILIGESAAVIRRIGHSAARAARKPKTFNDWIEADFVADHWDYARDKLLTPASALAVSCSRDVDCVKLVEEMMSQIRNDLFELTGRATADNLEQKVMELLAGWAEFGPQRLSERITQGVKDACAIA